jgi:hypothetical protein
MVLNKLDAERPSSGPIEVNHSLEMVAMAGVFRQLLFFNEF